MRSKANSCLSECRPPPCFGFSPASAMTLFHQSRNSDQLAHTNGSFGVGTTAASPIPGFLLGAFPKTASTSRVIRVRYSYAVFSCSRQHRTAPASRSQVTVRPSKLSDGTDAVLRLVQDHKGHIKSPVRPHRWKLAFSAGSWVAGQYQDLTEPEPTPHVPHLMRWRKSTWVNRTLVRIRMVANVVAIVISAVLATSYQHPWLTYVQNWGWLVVLVMIVGGTGLCTLLLRRWGDPNLLGVLHEILDQFRDGVFEGHQEDHAHHRVTLFQHRMWSFRITDPRWPLSGWLVPVERSGHTYQKTKTRFLAPDNPTKAEGIAGRAWIDNTAFVADLPDLAGGLSWEAISEYADKTYVPTKWVRKQKPHARSLMGFRIEKSTGEPWGVLVIDSGNPNLDGQRAIAEFRNYGRVLSRIVEGL